MMFVRLFIFSLFFLSSCWTQTVKTTTIRSTMRRSTHIPKKNTNNLELNGSKRKASNLSKNEEASRAKKMKTETNRLMRMMPSERDFKQDYTLAKNLQNNAVSDVHLDALKIGRKYAVPEQGQQINNGEDNKENNVEKNKLALRKYQMVKWDEERSFQTAEKQLRRLVLSDKELYGNYKRNIQQYIDKSSMMTLALVSFNHFNNTRADIFKAQHGRDPTCNEKWDKTGKKITKNFLDSARDATYTPPTHRMKVMDNLTKNNKDIVPVFCDASKDEKNVDIKNLQFLYLEKNTCNMPKRLKKEVEKEENIIKCNCCSDLPIVPCWLNENCPCYETNKELRKLQDKQKNKGTKNGDYYYYKNPTNFATFEPIFLNSNHYENTIGFACSDECGCKGKCTNNVFFLPEKKLYSLEVFRTNPIMGYGVRSLNAIAVGTPFEEFIGNMVTSKFLNNNDADYTLKLIDGKKDANGSLKENDEESLAEKLFELNLKMSDSLKTELKKAYEVDWYINPKQKGNVARTFCHSCEPNVAQVMVFQKNFSPSNARLLFVTTETIFPGMELTFDYGPEYVKDHFGASGCQCKKVGCHNNKDFSEIALTKFEGIQQYFALKHFNGFQRFKTSVLDKI